jgi:predicted nucleic acid-binding protein
LAPSPSAHSSRSCRGLLEWHSAGGGGWSISKIFSDQKFSIVDRTSFAVMERLGLSRVASLDDDFSIYRYGRNRDRAFEVLR